MNIKQKTLSGLFTTAGFLFWSFASQPVNAQPPKAGKKPAAQAKADALSTKDIEILRTKMEKSIKDIHDTATKGSKKFSTRSVKSTAECLTLFQEFDLQVQGFIKKYETLDTDIATQQRQVKDLLDAISAKAKLNKDDKFKEIYEALSQTWTVEAVKLDILSKVVAKDLEFVRDAKIFSDNVIKTLNLAPKENVSDVSNFHIGVNEVLLKIIDASDMKKLQEKMKAKPEENKDELIPLEPEI